jgi:hypothetical protein
MRRLSVKWVNACAHFPGSSAIFEPSCKFRRNLDPYVYMIQTPKNNPSACPHPKKFKTQKPSSQVLAPVFWDRDGILLGNYLERLQPS